MRGHPLDQSVTRTQYDPGTIRKFKRMTIGVEAPNSPAGAKYTRAAVKYTALILAAKLAALAAFALKVGPEL